MTDVRRQQVAVKNPYSIDVLGELPAIQTILAAWHVEISVDLSTGKCLDLVSLLRLNEGLDVSYIPASLLLRYLVLVSSVRQLSKKRAVASAERCFESDIATHLVIVTGILL